MVVLWEIFCQNPNFELTTVFRITLSADSLEVNDELGYYRDNKNYQSEWINSTIIINPSNSTD